MTRIAVTGHRGFSPAVMAVVDQAIRAELDRYSGHNLTGISCLADGADQIFARAVLDHGGRLEVIVPAVRYRDGLPEEARLAYDELLCRAGAVRRLDHEEPTSQSHMEASVEMLKGVDHLFAVWDGQPARAYGGTGDVVAHARQVGIPLTTIWPEGACRA
jgi:hypothetical protein